MGIAIDLWRIRIGCFSPRINRGASSNKHFFPVFATKKTACILLSASIRLLKVCLCFSLLLLLCGDVEVNPGPLSQNMKSIFPILGSFHQGDEKFSPFSRGRQCIASCIVFLIKLQSKPFESHKWKSGDVDEVLLEGDFLYRFTKQISSCSKDFLELCELPPFIKLNDIFFHWKVKNTYSGSISKNFIGEHPLVRLDIALAMGLSREYTFCIFVCKGTAVAISYQSGFFIVFDSHARDNHGLCCVNGTSVIILKETLGELCAHLRKSVRCDADKEIEQYDLHVINIIKTSEHSIKYNLKASELHICQISNNSDFESTVSVESFASKSVNTSKIQLIDLPFLNLDPKNQNAVNQKKRKRTGESFQKAKLFKKCENYSNDHIKSKFHSLVSRGPEYVCVSCNQVFFQHSVEEFKLTNNRNPFPDHLINKCIVRSKSVDDKEWICNQCKKYLKSGKIPPCSVGNGFRFPDIPPELKNLTKLEERLIAPRIPFMQIKEMPRGGQLAMHGNVVNVPADVNKTVKVLPRNMDASETIPLKLKRSVSFRNHIAFEQVRPERILEATKWLISNSKLFRNEGISLNAEWNVINEEKLLEENEILKSFRDSVSNTENDNNGIIDGDEWSEDEGTVLRPSGNFDTVMQPADYREYNRILSVAPAEGNTPLGMFQDFNAEFLSFPAIYCGETRQNNNLRATAVHYSTICKWELRNFDRRVAKNVTNIFFKLKKLQIKQISDKVSLAMRKCKLKGKKITVNEVLCEESIDKIIRHDEGYRVLRTLRGSPPYWERTKKDIFAMIRQLGIPTWFCSFSAAETKWKPLLRVLAKLTKNMNYTDSDILKMTWFEKNELIKADPVTCARYFDYRFQMFMNSVLKHDTSPIGKIKDFFIRVEFQQRGSPHVHILFWIDGAPSLGKNTDNDMVTFIDKFITCKRNSRLAEVINYQTHRHARTCRKKGQSVCRFGFPLPPLDKTMILHGFDENKPINEVSEAKKNFVKVSEVLDSLKSGDGCETTLEAFLKSLKMSYDDYLLALRSNIKPGQKKVFLKRNLSEIRINNYNEILIECWEANMDIQFILDPYACAAYIVSYISKGQRGMSNLLSNACREAKESEHDMRQQVRKVGNTFLTHVEVGAQEACYLVLQMPLRRSSRDVVFVDTNAEEDRVVLMKPMSILKELPKNSTSIESDSNIKRYKRRPYTMNKYCLADFVALFNIHYPKKGSKNEQNLQSSTESEDLPESHYELDAEDDPKSFEINENDLTEEHVFKDGSIMRKRNNAKVLYSVGFNKNDDKENFYREQIMLYLPWRNYSDILGGYITYEARYNDNSEEIEVKRKNYVCALTENIAQLKKEVLSSEDEPTVTESQHQDECDLERGSNLSKEFECFNPGINNGNNDYDLALDLNIGRKQIDFQDDHVSIEMPDAEFRSMVQTLNVKQKEFFYHVLNWIKTEQNPLYCFLSGGAGVGKSVLLRALHQALIKYLNHKPGENPDEVKVLICAPTGKAAFNVGGCTIHSAFNIPADQGFHFKPLDMQQLSTYQTKFRCLKVLFIDEISMVGKKMFNFINQRLQEIMGCLEPFGGVSVIAFGDLFQLKPVMDQWIFSSQCSCENIASLGPNLWVDHFQIFELEQIMRQRDDVKFAEILNRLREGNQDEEDIKTLKEQILQNESNITRNLPHLFTRRCDVQQYNKEIFSHINESNKTIVEAFDSVSGDLPSSMCEKVLSKLPDDASKTKGLTKFLCLGEAMPAEICINIDVVV